MAQVLARDMLALCQRDSFPSSTGAGGEYAFNLEMELPTNTSGVGAARWETTETKEAVGEPLNPKPEPPYLPPAGVASSRHSLVHARARDADGTAHELVRGEEREEREEREDARAHENTKARRNVRKFGFVKAICYDQFLLTTPSFFRAAPPPKRAKVWLCESLENVRVFDLRCALCIQSYCQ